MADALTLVTSIVSWGYTNLMSGKGVISDAIVVSIAAPVAFMVVRKMLSLAG